MAKVPTQKIEKTARAIEDMTDDERKERILDVCRIACPRFVAGDVDFETFTLTLYVPAPRDMDPRANLAQRQFHAENGVTKLERATLDYLLAGELRAYAPPDEDEKARAKKEGRRPNGRELNLVITIQPSKDQREAAEG